MNFDSIQLFVFDFDRTLISISTCRPKRSLSELNEVPLTELVPNTQLIRNFINWLINHGKKVAIASYGDKTLINSVMTRIFAGSTIKNPFNNDNIITPSDVTGSNWIPCYYPPRGYSKNNMLDILSSRFNLPADKILLIDDSQKNVNNAKAVGYLAILAPECEGGISLIQKILTDFGLNFDQILLELNEVNLEQQMANLSLNPTQQAIRNLNSLLRQIYFRIGFGYNDITEYHDNGIGPLTQKTFMILQSPIQPILNNLKVYYPISQEQEFPPIGINYSIPNLTPAHLLGAINTFYGQPLNENNLLAYVQRNPAEYQYLLDSFRLGQPVTLKDLMANIIDVAGYEPYEDGYLLNLDF